MVTLEKLEERLFDVIQEASQAGHTVVINDGIIHIQDLPLGREINFTVPKMFDVQ